LDKKESSFLPPKGTDGRYKDIMILHILGLILVLVLIVALFSSMSIMTRSIMSVFKDSFSGSLNMDDMISAMELAGMGDIFSTGIKIFSTIMSALGVVSWIAAILSIGGSIFIIYRMKSKISEIVDDPSPYENPIRVKKTKFILLGFLLGAYGGHLFALGKKRGWIYLIFGILGMQIFPLFIYTSGISFADAFMACFIEKDDEGYIKMEDYPYWI